MEEVQNSNHLKQKKNVQRSPNYPAFGLEEAVKKVKILWNKDGRAGTPRNVVMTHFNYALNSGTAFRALATLKAFGLTIEKDARIFLSKEALDIVNYPPTHPSHIAAIQTCALKPRIYSDLRARYLTGFPSPETLRSELIGEFKFNPKSVDAFLPDFQDTLRFSGLLDKDKDNGNAESVHGENDKNQSLAAKYAMDQNIRQQQQQPQTIKFDWTLTPGNTAHLQIVGVLSEGDREFLKLCLDRAIKSLAEQVQKEE
jgi:hypothetical protein